MECSCTIVVNPTHGMLYQVPTGILNGFTGPELQTLQVVRNHKKHSHLDNIGYPQIVLNELKRARLSRGRMIWLLAYPLSPPSPVTISSTPTRQAADGRLGGRGWASINHSILSGYPTYSKCSRCIVHSASLFYCSWLEDQC